MVESVRRRRRTVSNPPPAAAATSSQLVANQASPPRRRSRSASFNRTKKSSEDEKRKETTTTTTTTATTMLGSDEKNVRDSTTISTGTLRRKSKDKMKDNESVTNKKTKTNKNPIETLSTSSSSLPSKIKINSTSSKAHPEKQNKDFITVVTTPETKSELSSQREVTDAGTTTTTFGSRLCNPTTPTMDVIVHRIRHLQYHPKSILAMASSPENGGTGNGLVISRSCGRIQWYATPCGITMGEISGSKNRLVSSLCCIATKSESDSTTKLVWVGAARQMLYILDFGNTGQLVAPTPSGAGDIYCLCAIGKSGMIGSDDDGGGGIVAAGCQDGSVRMFAVVEKSIDYNVTAASAAPPMYQLQPVSTISSMGAAVLSLAVLPDKGRMDSVVFAGVADGTIRRYDSFTGTANPSQSTINTTTTAAATASLAIAKTTTFGYIWRSTLRMTVECYGRSTPTRVWSLCATRDGLIISGDSLGHVQFWDGNTGTLLSSFDQNDNHADVLAVKVTRDECKVFASGVDSRVICIERSTTEDTKWILTHAQRPHTHDVKAMALVQIEKTNKLDNNQKRYVEILCTGGLDTKLCTYTVNGFGSRRPRTQYPWPSLQCPVGLAKGARLVTMMREDHLDLYHLAPGQYDPCVGVNTPVLIPDEDTRIGTVQVKGMFNLACSAITNHGQVLSLSDSYSLVIFHLNLRSGVDSLPRSISPCKVPFELPTTGSASISALQFVDDHTLLVATSDGHIYVVMLVYDATNGAVSSITVGQTIEASTSETTSHALFPIHKFVFWKNGVFFATQRNSYSADVGSIDVYKKEDDGVYHFWWALPFLGNSVTAAVFLPTKDETVQLAVTCVNYATYLFDVERRALSKWSEKAGYPVSDKLPVELAIRNDFPVRLATNPATPFVVIVGSFGAMVTMNTAVDFPSHCRIFPETHVRGRKRKRLRSTSVSEEVAMEKGQVEADLTSCTMCLRYNSMIFMDFVSDNELVVVEEPWLNVVATFPDALQRKVYGT